MAQIARWIILGDYELIINTDKVLEDFEEACLRALERIGSQAEGYVIDLVPVDTGNLKNSIGHYVVEDEKATYIGTPNKYAIYVEMGTGMYVDGGRKTPWVYKDEKTGEWVTTRGQKAQPYLKPAITDHIDTYKNIVKDELGG
jgi:hypothetical protein